jgi:hypothetical protein
MPSESIASRLAPTLEQLSPVKGDIAKITSLAKGLVVSNPLRSRIAVLSQKLVKFSVGGPKHCANFFSDEKVDGVIET